MELPGANQKTASDPFTPHVSLNSASLPLQNESQREALRPISRTLNESGKAPGLKVRNE